MANAYEAVQGMVAESAEQAAKLIRKSEISEADERKGRLTALLIHAGVAFERAMTDRERVITTATRVTETGDQRVTESLQLSSPLQDINDRIAALTRENQRLDRRVTGLIQGGQQARVQADQVAVHGEEWAKSGGH